MVLGRVELGRCRHAGTRLLSDCPMIAHGRDKTAFARIGICNACRASLLFGGLIEASDASEASEASSERGERSERNERGERGERAVRHERGTDALCHSLVQISSYPWCDRQFMARKEEQQLCEAISLRQTNEQELGDRDW